MSHFTKICQRGTRVVPCERTDRQIWRS